MKWNMRIIAGLLLAAVGLSGCGLVQRTEAVELKGEPIYLGVATSLSGGSAMLGEGTKRGAEIAVAEFNAAGGYQGRPVKLVSYDDQANADRSLEVVTKLIKEHKVIGLIGPANSGNVLKHASLVQESGIPEVIPAATGTALTQQFPGKKSFIFRLSMVDAAQVQSMLKWTLDKRGFKKVAILHDATSYGQGGRDEITSQMAKRGLAPLVVQSFPTGQVDMTAQLEAIRQAGADVILAYALAPELSAIFRTMDTMGYKLPLMGAWMVGDPSVKKAVGPLVNNDIYTIQSYSIDANERARAFHEKVVKRYGEDIFPVGTAQGYDATRMLLVALSKAGPNPGAMRDALEALNGFEAITSAPAKPFGDGDYEALTAEVMFVVTYKNGVLVKVD